MRNAILMGVLLVSGLFAGALVRGQEETPAVGRRAAVGDVTPTPDLNCEIDWFFDSPMPGTCPEAEATTGEMVMQRFEYGFMIWVQPTDMIYVMHHTAENPRWLAVDDPYVAGMPERDRAWPEPQPPQSEQPRLGFGALWRENDSLRERIGWAVQSWEFVYDGHVQTAEDGTIYVEEPGGGVFALLPGADDWKLHSGS